MPHRDVRTIYEIMNYQFMFGPDLLVAPVVREGVTSKTVYLPEGKWHQFFTNEVYEGSRMYEFDTPLDLIQVFVRDDRIIPVSKEVGENVEQTTASGIEFLIFGKNAEGQLYLDDGVSLDYRKQKYGLYTITPELDLQLVHGSEFA